jgi:hypothetical protein
LYISSKTFLFPLVVMFSSWLNLLKQISEQKRDKREKKKKIRRISFFHTTHLSPWQKNCCSGFCQLFHYKHLEVNQVKTG